MEEWCEGCCLTAKSRGFGPEQMVFLNGNNVVFSTERPAVTTGDQTANIISVRQKH